MCLSLMQICEACEKPDSCLCVDCVEMIPGSSGFTRKLIALLAVGVVLLISIPLTAVGGYFVYRYMSSGGNLAPGQAASGRPRDRLIGQWQAPMDERPGGKMLLDIRADGTFIIAADLGQGPIADPTTLF